MQEDEIRGAMRELASALIARDVATVAALLDDEFTGFDASGVIVSKAQWLDDLAKGELVFESIEAKEVELTPVEHAVRVRALLAFRARYPRSNYNGVFRCFGMYVRRDGGWKLLVSKARVETAR